MINRLLLATLVLFLVSCTSSRSDWRSFSRDSAGIATPASEVKEDTVLIYSAPTYGFKGNFADHSWIAFIEKGDPNYTVAQVVGWRVRYGESSLVVVQDDPDRYWYGQTPKLITEVRGEKATSAIRKIKKLLEEYPHSDSYTLWPGPNSNTFVSHIVRNVSELRVELPPEAIGKDYIVGQGHLVGWSQTNTGVQLSLFGALGLTLGLRDGVEINLLGFTFGLDILRPAIKLPVLGRLGFSDN